MTMRTWCRALVGVLLLLFCAQAVPADTLPSRSDQFSPNLRSWNPVHKTARDTTYLIGPWGSGAQVNGQFEDESGQPAWNGWTHHDLTEQTVTHWQISDYHAAQLGDSPGPDNLAAWCGDLTIPACSEDDEPGGYGNNWHDIIRWTGVVENSDIGVTVHFTAYANIDSEPGYDFTIVRHHGADGVVPLAYFDGYQPNVFIDLEFTLWQPDYQGEDHDQVVVEVAFESDGGWSDGDCLWPTAGAVQIDDITVTLDQGSGPESSFTDFQDGWGDWQTAFPPGVGDFTQIWQNLEDIDPCRTNYSSQVAFIDDGEVVPGVGPSYCIDWCYGPGGYIVNTTGGAAGPDYHLYDAVRSPVIPWPDQDLNGALLRFTLYIHETLAADAPGMFASFGIRSADTVDDLGNPTGNSIENAQWQSDNFVYYGFPSYLQGGAWVDYLLVPGRDEVQVQLECYELGYAWGWIGNNGYPAPYYDNVRLLAFPFIGPTWMATAIHMANDNFPAIGEVDLANLGNNSVRFDMADSYEDPITGVVVAGDSIVVEIEPLRPGAELAGRPELHFLVNQNPLFGAYRTNPEFGGAPDGLVLGDTVRTAAGAVPGRWCFDLPDSNFLFPGDVIHYYITATDGGGPDGLEWQTITIPEDTTGFHDFTGPRAYSWVGTMRALPSVYEDALNPGQLRTPRALFWHEEYPRCWDEWFSALDNLGLVCGRDYDFFFTMGAGSGVGNGLGGRATPYSIMGYEDLIYSSGMRFVSTLSDGVTEPGNDLEVLDSWLRMGDRDLWLSGDSFLEDLMINVGPAGTQFVEDWLKVSFVGGDLRPLIGNQTTPLVKPIAGNGVYLDDLTWIAYGGCDQINTFTAINVEEADGGVRLAEFLSPQGASMFSYAAATLYDDPTYGSRVIAMPYDFSFIYTDPAADKVNASLPARARVLEQTLAFFGMEGDPLDVTPALPAVEFSVRSYPNPFNPAVKLEYTLARPGRLTLKVFDMRGQLVRTLIDEVRETDGFVVWDGTDSQGAQAASGVYFYEARSGGQVEVGKLVMLR
jgi:hypothetical protein